MKQNSAEFVRAHPHFSRQWDVYGRFFVQFCDSNLWPYPHKSFEGTSYDDAFNKAALYLITKRLKS